MSLTFPSLSSNISVTIIPVLPNLLHFNFLSQSLHMTLSEILCNPCYPLYQLLPFFSPTSVLQYSSHHTPLYSVNDVIADKNVVTKIMNKSTGLQRIELNGFAKRHWQTGYYTSIFCHSLYI